MRIIKILLYLLLVIIGISFAALNAGKVHLNFYFTQLTIPISLLMVLMIALGFIIGILVFFPKYCQLKINFLKTKNQLNLTEKEIKNLREIPLKDHH